MPKLTEIAADIEQYEAQEQASIQIMRQQLGERLTVTQERISKLIDMHIDGKIDAQTYHLKLEEYKREQQRLTFEIKSYTASPKAELDAAREVLELAKQAKEIFMSSNLDEKQQLLGFFFSNLTLNSGKLDVEPREPFKTIQNVSDQHIWRG